MKNEEKAYLYWLHQIRGIGDKAIVRLMQEFGSAKEVYEAPEKKLQKRLEKKTVEELQLVKEKWDIKNAYEKMREKGIRLISKEDREYPKRFRKMEQSPYLFYVIGSLPKEEVPSVAIIGARECSGYGEMRAEAFAERLAGAGVSIVSGMARGIDGISQNAAAAAGGSTYAVLGCGVDICYPASNKKLYEKLKESGGIISPYLPGTMPQKMLFPYRNQLVAGLSDAVLVIEARQKSGTWITVDRALEQGKDIYAVPGRLTDRLSDGCNLLIRQGAGIALSPDDILAELKMLENRKKKNNMDCNKGEEQGLLKWLDYYPKPVDEIMEAVKREDGEMTLPRLMLELVQLCMQGKAEQIGGNYFMKIRNAAFTHTTTVSDG